MPFKKGQSGNPGGTFKPGNPGGPGRPKKRPITDEYFALADTPLPEKIRQQFNEKMGKEVLKLGATWSQANALRRFLDTLMEGGHTSSKEIREAIEGKAPERLEITGPERKEIVIRLIHDRTKR